MSLFISHMIESELWKELNFDFEKLADQAVTITQEYVAPWMKGVEVSLLFTDNFNIHYLNRTYRGQNKPTNVLAFGVLTMPVEPEDIPPANSHPFLLGDIVISAEKLKEEALEQNKAIEEHLIHLVVHAMLHLLGYDHEDEQDALEMETIEVDILTGMGLENPYILKEHGN